MYRTDEDLLDGSAHAMAGSVVRVSAPAMAFWGAALKRAFDLAFVLGLVVVLLPLLLAVALGVRFSSSGPIMYSQKRLGKNGASFEFYKFRSMVVNSDEVLDSVLSTVPDARAEWDAYQKLEDDPRITRFGRLIRRTSLDELPQLWNVITGDMSLVGPRPCMPQQKNLYGRHWSVYCAVRPGLTGLWQVSGRNRLTYGERVKLDAEYVRRWSLWLDFKILMKTVKVVLTADGSK